MNRRVDLFFDFSRQWWNNDNNIGFIFTFLNLIVNLFCVFVHDICIIHIKSIFRNNFKEGY